MTAAKIHEPPQPIPRGKPVQITVAFEGEPDEMFFSYMRPGESKPVVDPGSRHNGTQIRLLQPSVYRYTIDTRGFKDGKVEWHFWSEAGFVDSVFGDFEISTDAPAQLL